jgi:hypothetical protein
MLLGFYPEKIHGKRILSGKNSLISNYVQLHENSYPK